jgi:hypothetical protein
MKTISRSEFMRISGKVRTTVLAASLIAAAVPALTTSADAAWGWRGGWGGWRGGGWGWGGFGLGLAAGAIIGGALASPYYGYYGYYPGYYAPAYYASPYYGYYGYSGGYWGRPYWHRPWGYWHRW